MKYESPTADDRRIWDLWLTGTYQAAIVVGEDVGNLSGVVGLRGLKNSVTVWVLCQLPQVARTSENRIKARNRAARRIQDQNQRIQGPNSTNRSTRIPHPVFNPCSEPVEFA